MIKNWKFDKEELFSELFEHLSTENLNQFFDNLGPKVWFCLFWINWTKMIISKFSTIYSSRFWTTMGACCFISFPRTKKRENLHQNHSIHLSVDIIHVMRKGCCKSWRTKYKKNTKRKFKNVLIHPMTAGILISFRKKIWYI